MIDFQKLAEPNPDHLYDLIFEFERLADNPGESCFALPKFIVAETEAEAQKQAEAELRELKRDGDPQIVKHLARISVRKSV